MNPSIEIRKLQPSVIKELVNTLEYEEYWKRLMAIIPKTLERENYECKVTIHNLPKYKSEHFRIIENESARSGRPCTEILFDEWGSSGRVRPALGHLLYLLTKAEVFRAAEYVAVELLHQAPPERPKHGPAAWISDFQDLKKPKPESIEKILDEIDYSSSLINDVNITENTAALNIDNGDDSKDIKEKPKVLIIPEIVISESRDDCASSFNVPLVVARARSNGCSNSNNENVASTTGNRVHHRKCDDEQIMPQISQLLGERSNRVASALDEPISSTDLSSTSQIVETTEDISVSDMIKFSSSVSIYDTENITTSNVSVSKLPDWAVLHTENEESEEKSIVDLKSDIETLNNNVPQFSELMSSISSSSSIENVPDLSALYVNGCNSNNTSQVQSDTYLPVLSALNASSSTDDLHNNQSVERRRDSQNTHFLHLSNNSRNNSNITYGSSLPNLSLNTSLLHYSYSELEVATNNFDKTPRTENGRFLGSGAFGSVFLALDLLDKPLAVKRLHLNNPDVDVTKQFKNEVEVLCKYKHENLVSLVGYSCDGPTYCLVYEYVPGGTLKDRLQSLKHTLPWQDRLHIALGTAKAVTYLHTAFSTPLIHRDIKSANILLDSSNKPKLCDFGLIKMTHAQHTTISVTVSGTSAYMAPEALRGDVSVKTDTFSFGVVLLELLTALPTYDPNRDGMDLVTYVEENCEEENIGNFFDQSAGSWKSSDDKDCGSVLFQIATKCLKDKKRRPEMVDVTPLLMELVHT